MEFLEFAWGNGKSATLRDNLDRGADPFDLGAPGGFVPCQWETAGDDPQQCRCEAAGGCGEGACNGEGRVICVNLEKHIGRCNTHCGAAEPGREASPHGGCAAGAKDENPKEEKSAPNRSGCEALFRGVHRDLMKGIDNVGAKEENSLILARGSGEVQDVVSHVLQPGQDDALSWRVREFTPDRRRSQMLRCFQDESDRCLLTRPMRLTMASLDLMWETR